MNTCMISDYKKHTKWRVVSVYIEPAPLVILPSSLPHQVDSKPVAFDWRYSPHCCVVCNVAAILSRFPLLFGDRWTWNWTEGEADVSVTPWCGPAIGKCAANVTLFVSGYRLGFAPRNSFCEQVGLEAMNIWVYRFGWTSARVSHSIPKLEREGGIARDRCIG